MAERERESRLGRAAGEFTERLAQGEDPSIEEFVERFPEVADEIRQVFPALRVMREVTLEPPAGAPPQELGDFRIHRELGRGGMAVVYEAQQLSLGRQVALKVLPFAAVLDARQLQRFKNEAQAAAHLHHAHQQGVIHRDIKPANLIIDAAGHLWITDFGLASFTNNPGLTMTGDIVGTLRYMSPEQALPTRAPVDHHTDIYSLGVTLYEFVTLEGAFQGDDAHQVIQDVAFKEPTSARSLNPAVPAELETVLMKAMAKSPEERYATAQELADDLERFLEHKPIRARRPTLLQRAAKWSRRRPAVVWAAIVVLAVTAAVLGASTVMLVNKQREVDAQAERAKRNSDRARGVVERMLTEVAQKDLTHVPHMKEIQRKLLLEALAFYEEFLLENRDDPTVRRDCVHAYRRMGDIRYSIQRWPEAALYYQKGLALLGTPGDEEGALTRITLSRSLCDALIEVHWQRPQIKLEKTRNPDVQSIVEAAHRGDLREQALAAGGAAVALAEQLVTNAPDEPEFVWQLARSHKSLGYAQHLKPSVAIPHLRQALERFSRLVEESPSEPRYRAARAMDSGFLAMCLNKAGQPKEAEECFHLALNTYAELVDTHPDNPAYQWELAKTQWDFAQFLRLGTLGRKFQRLDDAREAYRRAADLFTVLVRDYPAVPRYKVFFGNSIRMLGLLLGDEEKGALFEEGLRLLPRDPLMYTDLALHYATCRDETLRDPQRAIEVAEQGIALPGDFYELWLVLGMGRYRTGEYARAIEAIEKARDLPRISPYRPKDTGAANFRTWLFLAMAKWQAGAKEEARRCFDQAVEVLENAHRKRRRGRRRMRIEAAQLLGLDESDLERFNQWEGGR